MSDMAHQGAIEKKQKQSADSATGGMSLLATSHKTLSLPQSDIVVFKMVKR